MKNNYFNSNNISNLKLLPTFRFQLAVFSLLFLLAGNTLKAQVANYAFSQAAGAYSAVGTTNIFTTNWDDNVGTVAIPFTFNFNNVNYTSCSINSNGYITFGATASAAGGYQPISSATGYAGAVSAFGRDLIANGTQIGYTTLNASPNRVFVIQWTNARRYFSGGSRNSDFDFQIRLYETSNIVQVIYGNCATTYGTDITGQVGLRGATNADFNNRSVTNNWPTSTAGGTNAATCNTGTGTGELPASGLTYTWTPKPVITSFNPATGCAGATIVINGHNFLNTSAVTFNGLPASFTVNSATQITATIPAGATSGNVNVTTPPGTGSAALTINPIPTVAAITGTLSVCPASTTTLSNSPSGGTWSSLDTGIATVNAISGIVTGVSPGSATIKYTVTSGGCSAAATATVNVSTPTALSGPASVCIGNTVQMLPSSGGTWTSNNGAIASIDNTGLVTGIAAGTTTFTFTDTATGCSSTTAAFTVEALPSIATQPAPQSVCSGNPATFSVLATGTGLTYQWFKGATQLNNGGNISGATTNTLTINPTSLTDVATDYYCVVTGACAPAATSNMAALTVTQAVAITSQPATSQSLCTGNTASFTIAATGAGLTYQWYNGTTLLADGGDISGATTASLSLANLTLGNASNLYHCVVSGTSPCMPVTSNNSTLIVNQGPAISMQPVATQTVCAADSVSFSVAATGGSLVYQWFKGATALANGGNISGVSTPTLTINPTSPSDSANDYHCIVSNGCVVPANSNNSVLVVNEKPFISSYSTSVCSEDAFIVIPTTGIPTASTIVPSGTTYTWSAPVVTGGLTGGSAQTGQPAISQTLINPTNAVQTATYTVTPTSGTSGACVGAPFTVVVTVNPKPFLMNMTQSTCSAQNISITPANGGGNIIPAGTTYSWAAPTVSGGMTGGSAGTNQTSFNFTLINPTNAVQTATYNVTANSGSCVGSVFTIAVTVNPRPTVAEDIATQSICSGTAFSPITLSNPNGVAGTIDYSWTRNNTANVTGMPASGSGSPITGTLSNTTNAPQTTTFTLYATSDEGCISTNPVTVDVTVAPIPTITALPATQTLCSGNAITTINFSNPNGVSGTTYSWTRDNTANLTGIATSGTGTSITGNLTNNTNVQQTTIFTITASAAGCGTNTATVSVIVNPRPTVAATPVTQTLCGGLPISTITLTNPNAVAGTTYSWTRNNTANLTGIAASGTSATINGTLTNTTNVDQTTTFTINSAAAGCASASPVMVDVVVKPAPLAVASPAVQGVCTGSVANIAFSTTNNLSGTVFNWTRDNVANIGGIAASGSGNISTTVTNSTAVNQVTTFTIIAIAPNGCQKTITATLTVYPIMTTPGIEDSQVVCAGSRPTTFFITTPVTGGSGTYTYQWFSSTTSATGPWNPITGANAATYQPPTTTGTTPNTWYQVNLTSCGSTVTSNAVSVVVANNSNFNFSIDFGTGTFCPGANFNPRIYSFHGSGARIRYSWIGDPAYIAPASGGPIGNTAGCIFGICLSEATLPLVLSNNTNATVTTTISITPNIYDADTGAFVCSLSPQTTTITIRPRPTATATIPNPLICSGTNAGVNITSNLTAASAMIYSWTRNVNANVTSSQGSGTSGTIAIGGSYTIPDVLTNNSTVNQNITYTITPTSSPGGCPGTPTTITVTVSPQLLPGVVAANQTLCNGSDPAAFTQTTAATGGGTLTYQWQSSTTSATGPWADISGATAPTYDAGPLTQTTWFTRMVTSTISGITCSIGNTTPIQVTIINVVPGNIAGTQTICSGGDPVAFTSAAPGTGNGAITYQWQSNTTGCGGTWANIPGATAATYDVPAGLAVTTYYRRAAISTLNSVGCTDYSSCITVFVNNVTGGTVGSDETLCGNNPSAFTVITASTGAGTLTYQWQSNTAGCAAGAPWANINGATSATYDAPAGLLVTTYYRRVTTSTLNTVACTATSNCVTVSTNSVIAGAIGANRTVCMGGDPTAFVETAAASGTGLAYQWQISTVGGSGPWTDIPSATAATYDAPGPISVITYFRRLAIATVNSTACSAPSNFVTVFVNNVAASAVAGDQAFCSTGDPNAFTVTTAATGNGTLTYQWQSSTINCGSGWTNILGATGPTYDPPVISQTTYYHVIVTSTLNSAPCTAISNCITVTSHAKTWNGSISIDWNTAANWTPAGVPTAINCVVIPNTIRKPSVQGTNFNAYAYSVTILAGGNLDVTPTNSITVTDAVNVNASGGFSIENNASLVQVNNVANFGNINMQRTTQPMYRYDFTYWGSPVTLASGFTLGMLSPQTLFDKYFSWNPTISGGNGNWIMESASTPMNPNKGYIVRAPQTYSTNPASTTAYTANFIGVPNNGNISVPITIGALAPGLFNDKLNLLGNPYPSAVDADLFLNDATNASLIDGTIYFWTHHSPPSAAYANPFYGNFTYNYTAGDYATYTTLGGTNTVPAGYGGPTPNGYIAAGQGFFVKGLANGTAHFTNAMRVSGNNNSFFRSANTPSEKQRVWLNLANAQGGFSQILVGYAPGATLGYDRGFDASAFSGNFVSFYSVQLDEQTLTIQGKPAPFEVNDQVPLGYHATAANTYTIGIDHFDDSFGAQQIYLEDKLLNIIHDLKSSPYSFTSEVGTFNTRFVLRYTNTTLGVNVNQTTIGLIALIANEKLMAEASENISLIEVYDITGKLIATYKPKITGKKFESAFHYAEGIYIAKIKFENGTIETRKLVNSN